jgi:hypothetical protein
MSSLNAKGLCPIGAKERHEKSAESKRFTIEKIYDGVCITERKGRMEGCYRIYGAKEKIIKQKTKIKPISKDKATEIKLLSEIKKQKIQKIGKKCEICDKHGEVDLFHIIGVGDKKHSTNETNLLLSCRLCHLIWGANDWSKIVKFKNFNEIMERLKSLDEGKYWKLKHKIENYYATTSNI